MENELGPFFLECRAIMDRNTCFENVFCWSKIVEHEHEMVAFYLLKLSHYYVVGIAK